ncbi:hypothetical protein DPEC_G00268680 [Dallia pectoralis]|uniref:Uncharacterized protein n=1 Tax=Dallia pectoralis TaxID=75939 RepID=A0ACC2FP25_DALPE|nr:hypothetical protein DPEC_G00268680 [Dallia pectoralis]
MGGYGLGKHFSWSITPHVDIDDDAPKHGKKNIALRQVGQDRRRPETRTMAKVVRTVHRHPGNIRTRGAEEKGVPGAADTQPSGKR